MSKRLTAIVMLAGALSAVPALAAAALPLEIQGERVPSLAPMIKDVSPAVVNIAVRGSVAQAQGNPFFDDPFFRRFFEDRMPPQRRETQSAGSGVIVDAKNGYILTNHHVIDQAEEITVTLLDDRILTAEVVGSDAGSDVAVIKVEPDNLSDIRFADSDNLEVGDFVVAIGNPFGFSHTVTSGIVSALGRAGLSRDGYEDFIQTDASINPGNSGGALINLRGELVGINSAIISRSGGNLGIGFAIPVNMARSVMEQILEFGEVRRGLLGVNIFTVTPAVAEAYDLNVEQGALVSQVMPGSAAEKAGIRTGDVVLSVDGKVIRNATELRNEIGLKRVGEEVALEIHRDGRKRALKAKLRSQTVDPQVAAADLHRGLAGAEFRTLQSGSEDYGDLEGVLVENIEPRSQAATRGLRAGDVITHVNRKRVKSLDEFRKAAEGAASLGLTIRRGEAELLLPVL